MSKKIAFFDFDGTLVHGDSLGPFLVFVAGWPRVVMAYLLAFLCVPFRSRKTASMDARTFIKDFVLRFLLQNRDVESLAPAIQKLQHWPRWIEPTLVALCHHRAQGHHIVIASGGLDLYLKSLLRPIPHDAILCTEMEICDSKITGQMASGNCVRALKASRVRAYLDTHGPFDESWAYGNAPHDLPMMRHTTHGVVVRRGVLEDVGA